MAVKTIIIADSDTNYIEPLELKFVEEFHTRADLEVITDPAYFKEFFSVPRSACVLVVSEQLFNEGLLRHDIERIYVLVEEAAHVTRPDQATDTLQRIFKYTSTAEIIMRVAGEAAHSLALGSETKDATRVILFHSAAGGVGTTTVALGTAACLVASHKRVIYIDAEYSHSFQGYLQDRTPASNRLCLEMRPDNEGLFSNIRHYIKNFGFDYLPPFEASLPALNISFAAYETLIHQIVASGVYDYVIVDTDSSLYAEKIGLFSLADKMVILLSQDYSSLYKTEILANSIAINDTSKNTFVCNRFQADRVNQAFAGYGSMPFVIDEYIEEVQNIESIGIAGLTNIKGFQKLALLLM